MSLPSDQANTSDTRATLKLETLAPEIVSNVVNHVAKTGDLKSLRLVSKSLDAHARRKMFEKLFLTPNKDSIARWNAVADNESLSLLPRSALIQTRERLDADAHDRGVSTNEMEDFDDAVNALSKFPRLNSLEVAFTENCSGADDDSWWKDVDESIDHRVEILEWIFEAIRDKNEAEGASKIRSLTLRNLQNAPVDEFTDSALFSAVMQQLHELHISMIQEYNEHGPDHDYECIELRTFPGHLCSKWLKPVAPNLRALSLYSAVENWGPFPGYFDPAAFSISFPKLETLSLGYYTLAYDGQLDWIFAPEHKSLTKLVMHNCMIASLILIGKDNMREWNPNTRDWERLVGSNPNSALAWSDSFRYRRTWSYFFDKIAEGLPNLKEFVFDYASGYSRGSDEAPYGVGYRHHHTGAKLFPQRYAVFNNGILPSHWLEAEEDGKLEPYCDGEEIPQDLNFHVEFLEEDKQSLERLLEKCRARREAEGRR